MQISDTVEVIEAHGASAANKKLAEGWTLLAMVPGILPGMVPGSAMSSVVIYVLGKPAEKTGTGLYGQPV